MADKTYQILAELSLNSDEFKAGTAKVKQNVKDLMLGVEGATGNINEMRRALMSLKNISFAGKTEQEIRAITTQIGRLEDSIGDLRAKSKAMGQELGTQVAGSLQVVSAGVEAVVGSISLFGGSNETIEKLNKVMITMIGITQALGVIEDGLATKKLRMTALRIKETAVIVYNNVVNKAALIQSKAAIVAETARMALSGKLTIATRIATTAQWLWNAALAANPIGLVIAAIAALAAAVYGLVKAYDALIGKQKEQNKNNTIFGGGGSFGGGSGGSFGGGEEDPNSMGIRQLELYIKKMEARGEVSSKVINAEIILTEKKLIQAQKEYSGLRQITEGEEKETEKQFKQRQDALNKEIQELDASIVVKKISLDKAKADELQAEKDKNKQLKEERDREAKQAEQDAIDLRKKLDEALYPPENAKSNLLSGKGMFDKGPEKAKPAALPLEINKLNDYAIAAENAANAQQRIFDEGKSGWERMWEGISNTETLMTTIGNALNGLTEAFSGLFEGAEGGFKQVVTGILQGTQQIINALLAQAIAAMIAKEAYKGILGLALAAVGVAALIGLWKSKVPEFATGGIVPGSSYSGDNVPVLANSGEMILNGAQQRNLFSMINGGQTPGAGKEVVFKIQGTELVGVLNNYSRKTSLTR